MNRSDSRSFLGLEGDFLAEVARALIDAHGCALGQLLVLVPGRRAGRRLLELLLLRAEHALEPPRIVTEAGLAEELSAAAAAPASSAAVEWAWFEVLARAQPAELACLAPRTQAALDFGLRLSLARQLAALDRERAAEEGSQPALEAEPGSLAGARIAALAVLSGRVRERLGAAGRIDPARALEALRDPVARRADTQVVLAGVVEISPALRALLQSLRPRPRVLIQAGPDLSAGFDEFGALIPEFWEQRAIPLRESDWLAVDDPAAATEAALAWVAGLPAGTSTEDVAIGVLNDRLLPRLSHAFTRHGQPLHAAAGEGLRASAPWLALEALQAWLAREDFFALATALRHPDIELALRGDAAAGSSVAQLDLWHARHLPDSLVGELPGADGPGSSLWLLRDRLRGLCGELCLAQERPFAAWIPAIVAAICRLYPSLGADDSAAGQRTASALEQFGELARDLGSLGQDFWHTPLAAERALALWLDWSAELPLRKSRSPGSVEALGWLELALEHAPHLLLIGLNDGWVPQTERAHAILGENATEGSGARPRTRLARDVHVLTALACRRSVGLRAISLRRGPGDEPLRPSRLLFHAAEATALARARAFFAKGSPAFSEIESARTQPAASTAILPIPETPAYRPVPITGFKLYLNSPYLYYLQKVLRLERVRDDAWELDALGFGSLTHDVLEQFGNSDCRDATDAQSLEDFLHVALDQLARERFGERPLPAVRLQLQQLRRRLTAFARAQAREALAGWRIHEVEKKLRGATLDVDGLAVEISGRIDRIDRHQDGRRWRILDYKSGSDSDPRKAHVGKSGWKDLQLPLYLHCLRRDLPGEIELGYFMLPPRLEDCGVHLAEFGAEELAQALDIAREVLRGIRAQRFADAGRARPSDRVQRALCGLSLLELGDEGSEDSEEAAEGVE